MRDIITAVIAHMRRRRWLACRSLHARRIFDFVELTSVSGRAYVLHAVSLIECHDAWNALQANVEGQLVSRYEWDQAVVATRDEVRWAR